MDMQQGHILGAHIDHTDVIVSTYPSPSDFSIASKNDSALSMSASVTGKVWLCFFLLCFPAIFLSGESINLYYVIALKNMWENGTESINAIFNLSRMTFLNLQ